MEFNKPDRNSVIMSLAISKVELDKLKAISKGLGISVSDIVRQMIAKCLKAHQNKQGIQK